MRNTSVLNTQAVERVCGKAGRPPWEDERMHSNGERACAASGGSEAGTLGKLMALSLPLTSSVTLTPSY